MHIFNPIITTIKRFNNINRFTQVRERERVKRDKI